MRDIGFFSKERVGELIPGLLVTLGLAVVAYATWWLLKDTLLKFSALLWAFIFSIIASNLLPVLSSEKFHHGIEMSSTRLLRWSIALLGLTFSAAVWANLGGIGIAAVLINLVFAFTFGFIFCRYVLKLDGALTVLLSAGTSICGATAIAACGPAIRAKAEEMGLSLAVITLFGLVAMFGYPLTFKTKCNDAAGNNELKRKTDEETSTPFSPYNLRMFRQTYFGIKDILAPLVIDKIACVLPMQQPEQYKPWIIEICPASTLKNLNPYIIARFSGM